jgi:hypothetical protein
MDNADSLDEGIVQPVRVCISSPGFLAYVEVRASVVDALAQADALKEHSAWLSPLSQYLEEALRGMVPAESRPPSVRQLAYAAKIAKTLGVDLPTTAISHACACRDFITDKKEIFERLLALGTTVGSKAAKVRRWLHAEELVSRGMEKHAVAATLGVKMVATVDKYLGLLTSWRTTEPPAVQRIVTEIIVRAGIEGDIYAEALAFARDSYTQGVPSWIGIDIR